VIKAAEEEPKDAVIAKKYDFRHFHERLSKVD
jgi:hypothetical protein